MSDEQIIDKGAAVHGAGAADLDESTQGGGNPVPPAPSNEPPATVPVEPKPEDKPEDPPAVEDTKPEDKPLDTSVWGTTGDPVGDSVLTLLQNAGMEPDTAKALMYDAIQSGDVSKIDAAALEAKVGKATATLILAGAESFVTKITAQNAAAVKAVHDAAGGEGNWSVIRDWAATKVEAADLAEYRDLIDAGGIKAKFAVTELISRYNADTNNSSIGTSAKEIVGDAAPAPGSRSLSRAAYVSELEAAHKKGASEAVIAEINAARARGRTQGI